MMITVRIAAAIYTFTHHVALGATLPAAIARIGCVKIQMAGGTSAAPHRIAPGGLGQTVRVIRKYIMALAVVFGRGSLGHPPEIAAGQGVAATVESKGWRICGHNIRGGVITVIGPGMAAQATVY